MCIPQITPPVCNPETLEPLNGQTVKFQDLMLLRKYGSVRKSTVAGLCQFIWWLAGLSEKKVVAQALSPYRRCLSGVFLFIFKLQILPFVSKWGKQPRKNTKCLKFCVGMKTVFLAHVWTVRNIWEVWGGGGPWTWSEGAGGRQQLKILQQVQSSLSNGRRGCRLTCKLNGDSPRS